MHPLHPFYPSAQDLELSLFWEPKNAQRVRFLLEGDLEKILIRAPEKFTARKTGLWEETCFEIFLSPQNSQAYWEFNFSTSGEWDCFSFDDYRQNRKRELKIKKLNSRVILGAYQCTLTVELPFKELGLEKSPLHLGASAVLLLKDQTRQFWALKHSGEKPDFHLRSCFALKTPD